MVELFCHNQWVADMTPHMNQKNPHHQDDTVFVGELQRFEPVAANGYRARGIEPLEPSTEGATREDALAMRRQRPAFVPLIIAVLLMPSLASSAFDNSSRASQTDKSHTKMFQAPKNWKVDQSSEGLLQLSPLNLKKGETCRIGIVAPFPLNGTFEECFAIVQAPDPVVEESKQTRGKTKSGYDTLRQTKVVKKGQVQIFRHYFGLTDKKQFAFVLLTTSSEELLKAHLKEVESLVQDWDFTGAFPSLKVSTSPK